MKWADVLAALLARLRQDTALAAALGTDGNGAVPLYRAMEYKSAQIPAVVWTKWGEGLGEVTEPFRVQVDYFARGMAQARVIEGRLRALLHARTWTHVGGFSLSMQFMEDMDHDDPEPGVVHRSLDFRFEPVAHRA